MNDDLTRAYAAAVLTVAEAEGAADAVSRELHTVARAVQDSAELRAHLTDQQLPVGRRLGLVEGELLAAAHPATRSVLAMLIAAERVGELSSLVETLDELAATELHAAEVRTAVPLDEERRAALTAVLAQATGQQLDVRFVVDPDVVGGVRATVGDTVIDGSLLRRLTDLKRRVGL